MAAEGNGEYGGIIVEYLSAEAEGVGGVVEWASPSLSHSPSSPFGLKIYTFGHGEDHNTYVQPGD
jgi:hypothetical protein